MTLRENTIIKPGIGHSPIKCPHRILLVDHAAGVASIIEVARLKNDAGRRSKYARGPKLVDLVALEDALNEGRVAEVEYRAPDHWSMLDNEYLESSASTREQEKRKKRLEQRDANWGLIAPMLKGMAIRDIARNPMALRSSLVRRAKECNRNETTLYRLLNLYVASGGAKNSLIPATHLRGGPGVTKVQTKKLGRKSRLEKSSAAEAASYVLQEGDTEKLAIGYCLIDKSTSEGDAYYLTCGVYWATHCEDGAVVLFPPHRRPTRAQFRYWGRMLNKLEHRRRRIGLDLLGTRVTPGSTQDQVTAVGQMAMIDSTTNDVYLTSMFSRLKKLPPMHVTILKEVRSTVVIGFHVGWESPSTWTAHQAILCGAESKVGICARFGITITDEEWPSLLCKLVLADNGEMKSRATTVAEEEFRFAVEYTKSWSGQSKSAVETQHHTHHKVLDHKLPGTTHGKRRERGERHPALDALWNYAEYMREFLLMLIDYNNEEVEELAPTAMLLEGARPTRINILKWMLAKNMRADLPCDVERLRAFTMPQTDAVMTKRGIRLLMPDGRSYVPDVRFYSPALQASPQFREAVANNKGVNITVRQSETDLSRVWFAVPNNGLTSISNVSSDDDLKEIGTVVDLVERVKERALEKDRQRVDEDQRELEKLQRREVTTNRAKAKLAEELAALPAKPSKKSTVSNLKKNRSEEMPALQSIHGLKKYSAGAKQPPEMAVEDEGHDDAVSEAMDAFMRQFVA